MILQPQNQVLQSMSLTETLSSDGIASDPINISTVPYLGTAGFGFVFGLAGNIQFGAANSDSASVLLEAKDSNGTVVWDVLTTELLGVGDSRMFSISGIAMGHKGLTDLPISSLHLTLTATGAADIDIRLRIASFRQLPSLTNSISS